MSADRDRSDGARNGTEEAARSVIDDVVAHSRRAASGGVPGMSPRPARALAIVTCMDVRIDPLAAFGLERGDAHVIRNAGGRVTDDVLRSLAASWHFLGARAVMVVHHTDCGMFASDPQQPRRRLQEATGVELDDLDLLTFADEEGSVRDDVDRIRSWALTPPDVEVRGFIYDVDTGLLREVSADRSGE